MNKKITPKLLKHFKKITDKARGSTRLECIHYNENGAIEATDSHRLIHISNFHNYEKRILQNPETLEIITDSTYPDVSRIIKEVSSSDFTMKIDANELKSALKAVRNTKFESIKMEFKEDCVELSEVGSNSSIVVKLQAKIENKKFDSIGVNGRYLNDALMFATDIIPRLDDKIVTFRFVNSVRQFSVTPDNQDYKYIVTPVRF